MAQDTVQKSMTLLPQYQEDFLKNLLANVFQTEDVLDAEGNVIGQEISGFASQNPLLGTPVFNEDGTPMYQKDEEGNIQYDQYGDPIQVFEGGVAAPDIIRFTDPQIKAMELLTGPATIDPDTGEKTYNYSGIGAYKNQLDKAKDTLDLGQQAYQMGIGTPMFTTDAEGNQVPIYKTDKEGKLILDTEGNPIQEMQGGFADPSQIDKFYNPFVEKVLDTTMAELDRQGDLAKIGERAKAIGSGAFGGSRAAVQESELQRNLADIKAKTGADIRAKAFDNALNYGQKAAQLFGQLGQGIGSLGVQQGALGQAAQESLAKDVNALFNVGSLEQAQLQSEFDVARAGQLEDAYEPFGRFAYMRDILTGLPGGQSTLGVTGAPKANPIGNIFTVANTLSAGGGGGGLFGLGSLANTSGSG